MATIKSRKHANSFNLHINATLAAMLLPVAAHAGNPPDSAHQHPNHARAMPEVTVNGAAENDFKADKASSPKYTEELVNTAQTITVIRKELIQQQGAVTLTEALRNTPGVGTFFLGENGNTTTGDAIYMRGFDSSTSIYVDGVRDIGSVSRDVFNIEQVDVLKGPAGTDNGRAAPTGSVNLVSKQASVEDAFSGTVTAGTGSVKRATADVNRVINAQSGTAFRLNVMAQDSGNPARDIVNNKRWAVAPSFAFGLNGRTRAYLNFLHVDQDNTPDGGVPTIGLPGYSSPDPKRPFLASAAPVDPKGFYGSATDYDKVKADMLTFKVEHDFARGARLQNTSRYGKTAQDYLLTAFMGNTANLVTPDQANPAGWTLARTLRTVKDQSNEILTNQTALTLDFDTGAVSHTVVAGLELTREKQKTYGYDGLGSLAPAPLYAPDPFLPVAGLNPVRNGVHSDARVDTQSLYLFDTLRVGDKWIFNAGVRADHFDIDYNSMTLSTARSHPALPVGTLVATALDTADTLVNGKVSALYKPTPESSVYALLATSRQPPGTNLVLSNSANSASNPRFEPQDSTTAEIGAKWDLLKRKLSLSAALYQTTVKKEVEQDPVDLQYYQTGRKRVQGVEIGVTGEVARNWLASAGYTRMDTEVEVGKVVTASGINNLSYTPKQAFTAWTSYTLPIGLKLGGGARFVDKLLRGSDGAVGTPAYADSYWVFDAMASYNLSKNVELQLNVYNLGDEQYIAAINKSGYRYTPGAPRSASLTANIRF
ncbi:catecholate siderophore receptor Fiu [Massilia sp. GCM10020059]|uniref:Catecholate siderophore receptor Fiu n=1 Tax=Massilia agrisoli TaxID=2892444 RepID=A0ABS8ISJ6_9BURK|nr:catecholate siderophore receptor Fiu [Massilia agrisoli]MCC6071617.1 catecholate siderophore receptor Fiu [Massilia agrisoli]